MDVSQQMFPGYQTATNLVGTKPAQPAPVPVAGNAAGAPTAAPNNAPAAAAGWLAPQLASTRMMPASASSGNASS